MDIRGEYQPAEDADEVLGQLADENALLRASLGELQQRLGELEQVSDTDGLTSVGNRRRFLKELERIVSQAQRHGTTAALLFIDLRGMKRINEAHGRTVGDATLIHVATLLSGLIRSTDVLARVGGDKFAVILDHLDHNSAIETAERLGRCIAASPVDLGNRCIEVQAAVGVATILAGDVVDEVLARADLNMRRAKIGD